VREERLGTEGIVELAALFKKEIFRVQGLTQNVRRPSPRERQFNKSKLENGLPF